MQDSDIIFSTSMGATNEQAQLDSNQYSTLRTTVNCPDSNASEILRREAGIHWLCGLSGPNEARLLTVRNYLG
jgi:hypothetical protein